MPGTSSSAAGPSSKQRGFFGKIKDKAIGTKEEREEEKRQEALVGYHRLVCLNGTYSSDFISTCNVLRKSADGKSRNFDDNRRPCLLVLLTVDLAVTIISNNGLTVKHTLNQRMDHQLAALMVAVALVVGMAARDMVARDMAEGQAILPFLSSEALQVVSSLAIFLAVVSSSVSSSVSCRRVSIFITI